MLDKREVDILFLFSSVFTVLCDLTNHIHGS